MKFENGKSYLMLNVNRIVCIILCIIVGKRERR